MSVINDDLNTRYNELTVDEVLTYRMDERLLQHIEAARALFGIDKSSMRILDFGCGRGQSLARLRLLGYAAFGLEVDVRWVELVSPAYAKLGLNAELIIDTLMDKGSRSGYPDNYFHFVYSRSVFEHVVDVDQAVCEISRLSKPEASGYHQFVARWSPLEQHLRMPFPHWFKSNRIRWIVIYMSLIFGFDPKWKNTHQKTDREKAKIYFEFLKNEVFYRTYTYYLNKFRHYGLQVNLDILGSPRFKKSIFGKLGTLPGVGKLAEVACCVFKTVPFTTTKKSHI